MRIDPSNADQLRAWDGDGGAYWTARAERFNEGVAAYHGQFLAAAAIEPTANVLDIGCGSGQTTRDAARQATDGAALGVDLSSGMIELARQLAEKEDVSNATFEQADAQVHSFPEAHFDVAISRSGSMFFGDAPAAFSNIARALRPGARLVLMAWQSLERNEWISAVRDALAVGRDMPMPPPGKPGPMSLSEPDYVRQLLTSAGFTDVRLDDMTEPMFYGNDVDDAFEFLAGQYAWMVHGLDAETQSRAWGNLRAELAERESGQGIRYHSAAWLIQARR